MRIPFPALCLLFLALPACGGPRSPRMPLDRYTQDPIQTEAGYSDAVRVGNRIYVSGAVGWQLGGFPPDMGQQMQLAYASLERSLQHFGAGFGNVVMERIYTTDLEALKRELPRRKAVYGGKDYPATTAVQVSRLWEKEVLLEIEVIAALDH